MTDFDTIQPDTHKFPRQNSPHDLPPRRSDSADPVRLSELERENNRLQRLVAELLIKNQQLRKTD
jgi:hypothetical protein